MDNKMKEMLAKNLQAAIWEVDEHTTQQCIQTCQLASSEVDKCQFIGDVRWYLNQDKDLKGYYSETDIYFAVTNYLNER